MSQDPKNKPVDSTTSQPPPPSPPAKRSAPPAKKETEVPAFEKGLVSQIISRFGDDKIKVAYIRPLRMKVNVDPLDMVEVATFIRDNLGFDHAESVTVLIIQRTIKSKLSISWAHIQRMTLPAHILSLTTRTSRDDARLPTLINVYKSAEYHERETFEMLGVYFEGHPRNERFLLPEDWADIRH